MRQILCICLKYNTRPVMCKPFDQFEFLNQRRHSVLNDKKIKFLLRTYTLDDKVFLSSSEILPS